MLSPCPMILLQTLRSRPALAFSPEKVRTHARRSSSRLSFLSMGILMMCLLYFLLDTWFLSNVKLAARIATGNTTVQIYEGLSTSPPPPPFLSPLPESVPTKISLSAAYSDPLSCKCPHCHLFLPSAKQTVTWGGPDVYRKPAFHNVSNGRRVYKSLNCHSHLSIWYQRRGQFYYTSLTGQSRLAMRQELLGATAQMGEPGGRRTFPLSLVQSMHEHRLTGRKSVRGRESTRASGGPHRRSLDRTRARLVSFREKRVQARREYRGWRRDVRDTTKLTLESCPRPPQRVRASHTSCQRVTKRLTSLHSVNITSRASWFKSYVQEASGQRLAGIGSRHKKLHIVSWNVEGLRGPEGVTKMDQILAHMKRHQIDIVMMQETHDEMSHHYLKSGFQIYLSGTLGHTHAGVGFVIAPHVRPYVYNFIACSSRVCSVHIRSQPRAVHLTNFYAPSQIQAVEADTQRKEDFWAEATDFYLHHFDENVPFFAAGDFNARFYTQGLAVTDRVGPHIFSLPVTPKHTHEQNSNFLTEFLETTDSCLPASFIDQPCRFKTTYKEIGTSVGANWKTPLPEDFCTLDHLIAPVSRRNSVSQVRARWDWYLPSHHAPFEFSLQIREAAPAPKVVPPPRYEPPNRDLKMAFHEKIIDSLSAHGAASVPSPLRSPPSPPFFEAFTDGACQDNRAVSPSNPAGWGYTVRHVTEADLSPDEWTDGYGQVVTEPDDPAAAGALEGSNNTGELQALLELFDFLHRQNSSLPVVIKVDSQYALDVMLGLAVPTTHAALISVLRAQLSSTLSVRHLFFEKVASHIGIPGNERADSLAKKGETGRFAWKGRFSSVSPVPIWSPATETDTSWLQAHSVSEQTSLLVNALKDSAVTLVQRPVLPRKPYISSETWASIERLHGLTSPSQESERRYWRNKTKKLAKKDKKLWIENKLNEDYRGAPAQQWQLIKSLRKGFQHKPVGVRKPDGRVGSLEERADTLATYWAEQVWASQDTFSFSDTPLFDEEASVTLSPFVMSELDKALSKIRLGRSPGSDLLSADLIKWSSPFFKLHLLRLFNDCFLGGTAPDTWDESIVIALLKSAQKSPSDTSNYRPISLTQTFYKIYTRMLHARLESALNSRLRPHQFGFRVGRSCSQPVHIIRRILELFDRHDASIHILFLDWAKAFDTISHKAISSSLLRLGVPETFVKAIEALYSSPSFRVRDPHSTSASRTQGRGVRQGCPLSPFLFVCVLTCVMSDCDAEYLTRFGSLPTIFSSASPLWDMEYADDTVLFSRSAVVMERLLHILQRRAGGVGLLLNYTKCEHLRLNTDLSLHFALEHGEHGCQCCSCCSTSFDFGTEVPTSELVKYLGIYLDPKAKSAPDISKRMGKAYGASKLLSPFFKCQSLPRGWRLRVYSQVLQSIILYSMESQTITKSLAAKVDALHWKVIRQVLGLKSPYYHRVVNPSDTPISNAYISRCASRVAPKLAPTSHLASRRRMKFLGHTLRHPDSTEYQIMFMPWFSYRILYPPTLRKGKPTINFPEFALSEAYRKAQFFNNTLTVPPPHLLTSPFYHIPSYREVISLHGSNIHDLYSNLHVYRPVSQWANNKAFWAPICS